MRRRHLWTVVATLVAAAVAFPAREVRLQANRQGSVRLHVDRGAGSVRLQSDGDPGSVQADRTTARLKPDTTDHVANRRSATASSEEAHRIVSIIPATTEMLFAMGAADRVVAVGSYDRFPAAVEQLPRVGALLDPNVERILSLRPDLVVLYGTQTDLRTQLDRAHVPFFAYVHRGLPDITETIRALGDRVGVQAAAKALADGIEKQLADVRARVAGAPRPKTLIVFGREAGSLRNIDASGGIGFLHDMLEAAGGIDVLADLKQQSVTLSTEVLLARAPEVILELRYARGDTTAGSDLRAWDALASVPAVKNHRVLLLQGEEFVVPGPRVGAATERIGRALHPDLFK